MGPTTSFHIIFTYHRRWYAGEVYVWDAPGFYYYVIYLSDRQILFFVDDERDAWIENGEGATSLATIVGECIDRHYHPDAFLNNPPIDPE